MPSYDYKCEHCDHLYTVFKPLAEFDSKEKCPFCRKLATKVITPPSGFVLKGEGFHANDYPKEKK